MKYFRQIATFIVFLVVFSACTPTAETASSTEAPASDSPVSEQPAEASYPVPEQPVDLIYPALAESVNAVGAALGDVDASQIYPGLADGSIIGWQQLETLAKNGEVAKIVQRASEDSTVVLKDGRTFSIDIPRAEYVNELISNCGDVCKDIELVNE